MRLWRISNFADLSGRGGQIADGRWHRRGAPIVYCADHPSTSLLELLMHIPGTDVPDTYQLIEVAVPDDIDFEEADTTVRTDDLEVTRTLGSAFLATNRVAMMKVRSVVMPKASNFLINPRHRDSARMTITDVLRYPFDSRLFGSR